MKYRLTSAHPFQARFEELCAKAEELGLNLMFYGGALVVTDHLSEDKQRYNVLDIEGDSITMDSFPPITEYKIVYDKPEPEPEPE
jgi:hypothetical protein